MDKEVTLEELEAVIKKTEEAENLKNKNNELEVELEELKQQRTMLEAQKLEKEGNSHGLK